MSVLTEIIVSAGAIESTAKQYPNARLIAITHGDPSYSSECGRPISYRATRITERRSADLVAVCPLHGDVLELDASGNGYMGLFALFAIDARPRRKHE